jgi:HPt (histidine-containing phosphotransfer) domain-containing protein
LNFKPEPTALADRAPAPHPPDTVAQTPVLDPVVTQRLRELATATDPSILQEIYETFESSALEYLAALRQAVEAGDAEALRTSAHALKGASANVGAVHLTEAARQLEMLGQTRSLANAGEMLARVQPELVRVQRAIQAMKTAEVAR